MVMRRRRPGGGGGCQNGTVTFEPETKESIGIKLFICLFTMKNRREESVEHEGQLERHHDVEEKGRKEAESSV